MVLISDAEKRDANLLCGVPAKNFIQENEELRAVFDGVIQRIASYFKEAPPGQHFNSNSFSLYIYFIMK
jgi:hypothetical protein